MSPVAFVNYAVQVAEALSVMVQKKRMNEMHHRTTQSLTQKVWILMSVKLARDQTHGGPAQTYQAL